MVKRARPDSRAAVVAGLLGGAAFVAVLEADLRLTGRNVDDMLILGRPFTRNAKRARRIGLAVHALNAIALAALYARVERRLPGPPWFRGLLFANLENLLLYPITLFEELHPAVREGSVARYRTWPAFWQSVPRHIAYGIVLGMAFDRLTDVERSGANGTEERREAVRGDPPSAHAFQPSARPCP